MKTMTDSRKLLEEFVTNSSEPAFRELVQRYVNLVFSTALRQVDGDSHLAEDVTQTVFVDLAQLAKGMSSEVMLGGWLHRHTCFVASKTMRTERRRKERERKAAEMNEFNSSSDRDIGDVLPLLDEAVNRLSAQDRNVVLLRFFEQLDFLSVAAAIGTTEAAAQKRVTRAVEKMQRFLRRRGVTIAASTLATTLASNAVTTAPAFLVSQLSGMVINGASIAGGTSLTFLKFMATTKLKLSIISVAMVTGLTIPLIVQHRSQNDLKNDNHLLQEQVIQLTLEKEQLSRFISQKQPQSTNQTAELMRLRNDVGMLRKQLQELASLKLAVKEQSSKTNSAPDQPAQEHILPKESWSFVGYATPETALQSVMWAMKAGDVRAFLASLTPEAQTSTLKTFEGKSEDEIATLLEQTVGAVGALRLDRVKQRSDTEVSFVLRSEETDNGDVRTRDEALLKFTKWNGEWKSTGL